jgi:hypothetical protein
MIVAKSGAVAKVLKPLQKQPAPSQHQAQGGQSEQEHQRVQGLIPSGFGKNGGKINHQRLFEYCDTDLAV